MKAIFSILFLIGSVYVSAQTQLKFTKVSNMSIARSSPGYTQDGDHLYAIGGSSGIYPFSRGIQVYDLNLNEWIDLPLKDLPELTGASAIYLDEYKKILVGGGIRENGHNIYLVKELRIIDPVRFTVERLGELPVPANYLGMAQDKGLVYIFGGSTKRRQSPNGPRHYKFSKKMYAYEMVNGVIHELPDLPVAMETKGGISDSNLYVFGGYARKSKSSIWKFDIQENKWHKLEPFNKPVSAYALAQYKHYFILVGDYFDGDQLIVYDTKTESARYFRMNIDGRHMGASVVDSELHVYGGRRTGLSSNYTPQHYKISLNQLINFSN